MGQASVQQSVIPGRTAGADDRAGVAKRALGKIERLFGLQNLAVDRPGGAREARAAERVYSVEQFVRECVVLETIRQTHTESGITYSYRGQKVAENPFTSEHGFSVEIPASLLRYGGSTLDSLYDTYLIVALDSRMTIEPGARDKLLEIINLSQSLVHHEPTGEILVGCRLRAYPDRLMAGVATGDGDLRRLLMDEDAVTTEPAGSSDRAGA